MGTAPPTPISISRWLHWAPLLVALLAALAALPFLPAVQDPHYHNFADDRSWAGIPNFANVLSNVPFIIVGAVALYLLMGKPAIFHFIDPRERISYVVIFSGVFLTGFGSAFYHLQPDDARLVWDRLPLTVIFMSFFAAMLSERVDPRLGFAALWPLLVVGLASLVWWRWANDLRPYILVQFFPLAAIPLLLLFCPGRYTRTYDLFIVLGWYVAAKAGEHWDRPLFDFFGKAVSGHTLKHVLSAGGAAWLVWTLVQRRPTAGASPASTPAAARRAPTAPAHDLHDKEAASPRRL